MSEERRMRIVRSLAGRDKGRLFLVVGVTEKGELLLADGKMRKVETPKKKKEKHTEPLEGKALLEDCPAEGMLTNRQARALLHRAESFFNKRKE